MRFKNLDRQANFADFILKASMDKNRCLEQLMNLEASIDWAKQPSLMAGAAKFTRLNCFSAFTLRLHNIKRGLPHVNSASLR